MKVTTAHYCTAFGTPTRLSYSPSKLIRLAYLSIGAVDSYTVGRAHVAVYTWRTLYEEVKWMVEYLTSKRSRTLVLLHHTMSGILREFVG